MRGARILLLLKNVKNGRKKAFVLNHGAVLDVPKLAMFARTKMKMIQKRRFVTRVC